MPDALHLALALIRGFEGLRLHAYPDPATGGEPWTIGFGATGPGIGPNSIWTEQEAEADLERRVAKVLAKVRALAPTLPGGATAAVTSLVYNCGDLPLERHLGQHLRAGEWEAAAAEFPRWDHAAGKENAGLKFRREAEQRAFLDAIHGAGSVA